MPCFNTILVGVDLTKCRPLDISELGANARETIHHAIWLAKLNSARLLFFAVLPLSEKGLQQLREARQTHVFRTIQELANRVLAELVQQAAEQGVDAESRLVVGKDWQEIILEVPRGKIDLVVVGPRELTGLRRMLFGSTALKLFRRCPCPVWVSKPGHSSRPLNILIATDLKAASQEALRLGVGLGKQMGSVIHVLHIVDYPLDSLWGTAILDKDTMAYHRKIRTAAEQTLQAQLRAVNHEPGGASVQVHLAEGIGLPDEVILHFLEAHHIDLLIMGTIARGGVVGITIGNTAERLLPEVPCSVLAVKPPDFVSPVKPGATVPVVAE